MAVQARGIGAVCRPSDNLDLGDVDTNSEVDRHRQAHIEEMKHVEATADEASCN